MTLKCCTLSQQIWKSLQWPQDWKRSIFILVPKKGNSKCSNYCTIALISHASKVMLKILQARLQQYMNQELPDVQVGFRKVRGTRDQIANIWWIIEKAREFTLMAESKELKSLWMKVKEESEKAALKFNIQKTKIMASGPITSIDGATMETVRDFILGGSKIRWWLQPWN